MPPLIIQQFKGRDAVLANDLIMLGAATVAAFVAKHGDDKASLEEATTIAAEILQHILERNKAEEIQRITEVIVESCRQAIAERRST